MKIFVLLISLVFGTLPNTSPEAIITYDLATAIEKNWVTSEVTGNEDSPHYLKPITISITNISNDPLSIRIPNGQLFTTTSEEIQDVVITREELLTLAPKKQLSLPLYAMCVQQRKSGANVFETYELGPMASGNLAELTQEIEKRNDFNTLGQYAVWSITDGDHLNSISGFDMDEALHLKTFVANLMGVPVPEYDPNDYRTNYEDPGLVQRAVKSRFKFYFSEESAVTIAMFDEDNIVVRELYNNPKEAAGTHYLEFEYDIEVYTNKAYYVRLIRDEEIEVSMKMEPRQG